MQTKYNIVKQAIKSQILDGTYQPHQKISSESELMKQFGVSRHTVRLAIGDLVNQGWLYREQGAGTFCADRSREDAIGRNQQKI
ncbi:GntR family transcriptional regulator [Gracilibacillus sp. JCM 18860]|uniref:GntR family transcriptional regulator n=1 Tax=Gracilibacillus sp. JCM 18860 TaxID=1306159 RepID=UPI000AC5A955